MLTHIRNPLIRRRRSGRRFPASAPVSRFGFLLVLAAALILVGLISGCTGPRARAYRVLADNSGSGEAMTQARKTLTQLYPPEYRATQRAIIRVGRKQFVCDGMLTVSPQAGWHLALISTLGLVTDVRLTTNGTVQVVRVTPLFTDAWSREFVSRDLRQLFALSLEIEIGGRLPDGRFVLESRKMSQTSVRRYIFTPSGDRLQEMEIADAGRRLYHVFIKRHQRFTAFPQEVPSEFEVFTPGYTLELRTVELGVLEPVAGRVMPTSQP